MRLVLSSWAMGAAPLGQWALPREISEWDIPNCLRRSSCVKENATSLGWIIIAFDPVSLDPHDILAMRQTY